jgi:LacI family transcriptional regulator
MSNSIARKIPPPSDWRPSLKQIAADCGVTVATVSRILNSKSDFHCSAKTDKKVRESAAKHKYLPNQLTRGIRDGRTRAIGVISAERLSFHTEIIHGIHHGLADNDYVMIHEWNDAVLHTDQGEREKVIIQRLIQHRVDGIILFPTNQNAAELYFCEVKERNIPLVVMDIPLPHIDADFVGTDNHDCGFQAGKFLIAQGHRDLFTLLPSGELPGHPFMERAKGFEDAVESASNIGYQRLEYVQKLTGFSDRQASIATNIETVVKPLLTAPHPIAVFCVSDMIAKDVYRLAKAQGCHIPDDISVIGVGNLDYSELIDPPLTTFEQHPYEIGLEAALLILKRLQKSSSSRAVPRYTPLHLKTDLILRESVRQNLRSSQEMAGDESSLQPAHFFSEMDVVTKGISTKSLSESVKVDNRSPAENSIRDSVV